MKYFLIQFLSQSNLYSWLISFFPIYSSQILLDLVLQSKQPPKQQILPQLVIEKCLQCIDFFFILFFF